MHDTVEDSGFSRIHTKKMFGGTVDSLVNKVTKLDDTMKKIPLENHSNMNRLLNAEDHRVAFIKLADRLHNMRTVKYHSSMAKQHDIAKESLYIFVPMAKKLLLYDLAQEMEELCLQVLNGNIKK